MSDMVINIIVGIIVFGAAAIMFRNFYKTLSGKSGCGCGSSKDGKSGGCCGGGSSCGCNSSDKKED